MKVLITGAGGKLAGEIAESFADKHELAYTARGPVEGLPAGSMHIVDMTEQEKLAQVVATERPEVIIHLAAMLGPICEQDPELAHAVNVTATKTLAEAAKEHQTRSFIFASTAAVYNTWSENRPMSEIEQSEPRSVYGQTKLAAEAALAEAAHDSMTDFTALRIFNVYGRRFTDSLVTKLIHSTEEAPVGLVGPDTFVRDYVHVSDIVDVCETIMNRDSGTGQCKVYNIGSGVGTSNGELVAQLEEQGVTPHYTMKPIDSNVSWADITRAQTDLGFNPHTSIIVEQ